MAVRAGKIDRNRHRKLPARSKILDEAWTLLQLKSCKGDLTALTSRRAALNKVKSALGPQIFEGSLNVA